MFPVMCAVNSPPSARNPITSTAPAVMLKKVTHSQSNACCGWSGALVLEIAIVETPLGVCSHSRHSAGGKAIVPASLLCRSLWPALGHPASRTAAPSTMTPSFLSRFVDRVSLDFSDTQFGSRPATFATPACAQTSSLSPPGAPPTPRAPTMVFFDLNATAPGSAMTLCIVARRGA